MTVIPAGDKHAEGVTSAWISRSCGSYRAATMRTTAILSGLSCCRRTWLTRPLPGPRSSVCCFHDFDKKSVAPNAKSMTVLETGDRSKRRL